MQITHSQAHLNRVEFGVFFGEMKRFTEVGEEFAPAEVGHEEEEFGVGLEGVVHCGEEGVGGCC